MFYSSALATDPFTEIFEVASAFGSSIRDRTDGAPDRCPSCRRSRKGLEIVGRKRIQVDQLVWLIHEEVLARVGSGKQFSLAVGPDKQFGWTVRVPAGGRPFHPDVITAIHDVEREFQSRYAIVVTDQI